VPCSADCLRAFGGLIAYGVGHINGGIPRWKYLFIIEAVPTVCLGLFCLYWLPDRPLKNSRFSGKDQEIAEARYYSEEYDKAGKVERRHFVWVFTDWKLYAQVAVYFPTACLLSSISGFLPTIISGLGYTKPTTANLMTVPPYACAFALMYFTSWLSDRYRIRGVPIAITMVIAGICYALLATLPEDNLHGKYGCMCVAVACVYATYPPSHAWAVNNFGNETKRAIGAGAYTAMGNFGSIAGSWFYPSTDAPQFIKGHYICMALAFVTAAFSIGNSLLLRAENRRRDRLYGTPEPGQAVNITELADRSPHFRYIL
jgi:hypothetical protein